MKTAPSSPATPSNPGRRGSFSRSLGKQIPSSDPKGAVEAAKEFGPELMFVDVVMPGMDGGDVVAAIQAEPRLKRVPTLMLTALVEENEATPTGESERGGLTFVSKTTHLDKILDIIESHL